MWSQSIITALYFTLSNLCSWGQIYDHSLLLKTVVFSIKTVQDVLSFHQELKLACAWTALGPVKFTAGVRLNTTRDQRKHSFFLPFSLSLWSLTWLLIVSCCIHNIWTLLFCHFVSAHLNSLSNTVSPCWVKLKTSPSTSRISSGFPSLNSPSKWLHVEVTAKLDSV